MLSFSFSVPCARACMTSSRSSSALCTFWWPPTGFTPTSLSSAFATPLSSVMNGLITRENSISGRARYMLTRSGATSAMDLGASSPSTMCRNVMTRNAVATPAVLWATPGCASMPTSASAPSTTVASAGSPIQPNASDASVMPSCVPEM